MFANQEIRYQPQPSPLTACTPYPAFPRGPALPLPHQQRDTRSKMQQPRSLALPSRGVPGRGRALGAPSRHPRARSPAPATGEHGGDAQGEAGVRAGGGHGQHPPG